MNAMPIIAIFIIISGCSANNIRQDSNLSEEYMKGEAAYKQKNYSVAKQHYEKITQQHPDNIAALFKLANISMHEKNWGKAMQYYTIILKLKPTHEKAHHNLAMLHLHQARNHLSYYVAHNNTLNNQSMGKLIEAINDYSNHRPQQKTSLDRLADSVR